MARHADVFRQAGASGKWHAGMMLRMSVLFIAAAAFMFCCPPAAMAAAAGAQEAEAPGVVSPVSGSPAPALAAGAEDYLIGPGDVIDISVWKDEALTRSVVVRPDGAISFPLIGDVPAAGKTPAALKAEMEKRLERFVLQGVVSLEVKQINSLIVYVIGKVNAPGRFVVNTNVDVLQALATAGGVNIFAKRNRIKVYRRENNATTIIPFEYDEVIEGRQLEQNIRLKRGDVVVVP